MNPGWIQGVEHQEATLRSFPICDTVKMSNILFCLIDIKKQALALTLKTNHNLKHFDLGTRSSCQFQISSLMVWNQTDEKCTLRSGTETFCQCFKIISIRIGHYSCSMFIYYMYIYYRCRNIFAIRQSLTNVTSSREMDLDLARQYYELLNLSMEVLNLKTKSPFNNTLI